MKQISVEYTAQARKDVIARAELTSEAKQQLLEALNASGIAEITIQVVLKDVSDKQVCAAAVLWQLKEWSQVRSA
jgi:hypothetical protein